MCTADVRHKAFGIIIMSVCYGELKAFTERAEDGVPTVALRHQKVQVSSPVGLNNM